MSLSSKNKIKKENSLAINESNVINNHGIFQYRNGDQYNGYYVAYKDTINLAMEGEGIYTTEDGHIYDGIWENNILKSIKEIRFPDESVFYGQLENMTIQGTGVYKFKEGVDLEGNFENNKLIGEIILKDPNGHKWIGDRISNEKNVLLMPVNVFWDGVLKKDAEEWNLREARESEGSVTLFQEDLGE